MGDIWSGATAVVTGGASGLGRATAAHLVRRGLKVAILDRDEAAGQAAAADLDCAFHPLDVADAAGVAAAIDAVEAASGPLRVLVNCAGIAPAARTVGRGGAHDPALFERVIRVNLIGSFACAAAAAARMAAAEPLDSDGARGVIVHTASVAAFDGQVGQVAYAASKGAIVGMTLPMARDLAGFGIRVVTIAPGLFLTPLVADLPAEVRASLGAQVPFPPRLGDPGEYAALVGHILTNPMLNGEVIRLDGAIRMAPR